jgi:hypothetical protein
MSIGEIGGLLFLASCVIDVIAYIVRYFDPSRRP